MSGVEAASRSDRPVGRVTDHLANERTYLAWVRTALGLIGIGFVLARMGVFLRQLAIVSGSANHQEFRGGHEFLITGVFFLLLGATFCLGSGWYYQRSRKAIDAGQFEPARHTITVLTMVVVLGTLILTGLLLRQLFTLGGA
jgi:putative membrane protein